MSNLDIQTAEVFLPLLNPARYKGAHGGRGSGKTNIFGEMAVEYCLMHPGARIVCVREVQKTLAESSKQIIEDKIVALGVGRLFRVLNDKIETPGDGLIIFQGMKDHSAESIKSLEGFDIAWVDEAQTLSERSLSLLRPTIRKENSEIWFSWNPRKKGDAVDKFLRSKPPGSVVVKANWRDNPWFPSVLEEERKLELERYPERYDHTWEGDYAKAFEGAYFAAQLGVAKREGRICKVSADPLLPLRAFIDIGGSSANADAFSIWIAQWVSQEIRVLNYYEAVGQPLAEHVTWLRDNGYEKAILHLPHDGIKDDGISGKRYKDHLSEAGFDVAEPLKNQGAGAASMRVEAVRRVFPKIWFNESTTESGRTALGFYHERKDENRDVGLGPDHDWSSHCADAFGLMAVLYEEPSRAKAFNRPIIYPRYGVA